METVQAVQAFVWQLLIVAVGIVSGLALARLALDWLFAVAARMGATKGRG